MLREKCVSCLQFVLAESHKKHTFVKSSNDGTHFYSTFSTTEDLFAFPLKRSTNYTIYLTSNCRVITNNNLEIE